MDVKENVQLRGHLMWQNGASNCLAEAPGEGVGLSRLFGSGSVDRSETDVSYSDVSNREQHLASSSERDPLTSRSKRDPQSPKATESREIPRKFLRSRPLSDAELDRKRIIANVQERRRMQRLNNALDRLKRSIPSHLYVPSRRLSKIKTLKLAIEYIAYLNDSLHRQDRDTEPGTQLHSNCFPAHCATAVREGLVSPASGQDGVSDCCKCDVGPLRTETSSGDPFCLDCESAGKQLTEVGDLSLYCAEMVHRQDQSPYFLVSCQLE